MAQILGLFDQATNPTSVSAELEVAGFRQEQISWIENQEQLCGAIRCKGVQLTGNDALIGALLGVLTYLPFAIFAALCQCGLFDFSRGYGALALVGGLLAGAFVGGAIGSLVGMARYSEIQGRIQDGLRSGSRLLILETDPNQSNRGKTILKALQARYVMRMPEVAP